MTPATHETTRFLQGEHAERAYTLGANAIREARCVSASPRYQYRAALERAHRHLARLSDARAQEVRELLRFLAFEVGR